MKSVRRGKSVGKQARKRVRRQVQIGAPDPSLTRFSGVSAVAEMVDKLDVVARLDRGIGLQHARAFEFTEFASCLNLAILRRLHRGISHRLAMGSTQLRAFVG